MPPRGAGYDTGSWSSRAGALSSNSIYLLYINQIYRAQSAASRIGAIRTRPEASAAQRKPQGRNASAPLRLH